MEINEIYKKMADKLCLALILNDNESYKDYRNDFEKYNVKIKPEPYSNYINRIIKELDDIGEDYGLDHIIKKIFGRNRGSWEREQFAIYSALKELTEIDLIEPKI